MKRCTIIYLVLGMRIPARIACCLYLVLNLTACSKKITFSAKDMAGYYSQRIYPHGPQTPDFEEHVEDLLELTTNGRFIYEQFYLHYNGDDVGATHFSWISTGVFTFYQNKIILHFDSATDLKNIDKYFIRQGNEIEDLPFSGKADTFRISKGKHKIKIGKMLKVKDIKTLSNF